MPSSCRNRSRKLYGGAKTANQIAEKLLRKKAASGNASWARYFAKKNANSKALESSKMASPSIPPPSTLQKSNNFISNLTGPANIKPSGNLGAMSNSPYNASFNTMTRGNSPSPNSSNLSQFNNALFQAKPNAKVNSMIAQNEKTVNAAAATEVAASEATAAAEKAVEPSFLNKIMGTPAEQKNAIQVINNANNKAKNMAKLANNAAKVAANAAKIANSLKAKVSAIGGSRRSRRNRTRRNRKN